MMTAKVSIVTAIAMLLLVVTSPPARAEQEPVWVPAQAGPLVVTPVSNSVVFSPDVKITTVNHSTAVLVGGYVGKLMDQTLLIGGGAYWLVDPRDEARMFYTGLIVDGRVIGTPRVRLAARGFLGLGQATIYQTQLFNGFGRGRHHGHYPGWVRYGAEDFFWMAEPEARLTVALTHIISFDLGAGYRVTTADGGFNERLRGATGSIGIRFNVE